MRKMESVNLEPGRATAQTMVRSDVIAESDPSAPFVSTVEFLNRAKDCVFSEGRYQVIGDDENDMRLPRQRRDGLTQFRERRQ
jgi:hypothetical protein